MTKSNKQLLGAMTFLPLVGMVFYVYFLFRVIVATSSGDIEQTGGEALPATFYPMMITLGVTALISLGMLIYYLVHIAKKTNFKISAQSNARLIWILVVLLAGFVGMIAYFFVEVWPEPTEETEGR